MIDLIPLPYKIAGIALVMIICAVLGYMKGYENANDKYLAFKTDVAQQTAQLEADAEKARLESERVTADVSKAWAAALNHARANPRIVRVRDTSCGASSLSSVSATGLKPDATSVEQEFGARADVALSVAQCEEVANNAVMDAAALLHLQAWVKQQSEVQR